MITEYLLKNSALSKYLITMDTKLKKLAVTFAIMAVLLSCTSANMKIAFSNDTGGKIDLFTQKEPYSGKGPNMPSDAFGPGEEVQIYALVTYNEEPVQNLPVAFEILGPKDHVDYRTVFTNEKGIATISFRISHLNDTTFGEWTVIGNTKIGDLTFQDLVMFRVGWIVEIVSIETNQEKFTRGSYVGIELVLRNIAMTEKKITVAGAIYDCLNIPLNSTEIEDFELQPDDEVPVYCFLYIPKSARVGEAIARACVYTAPVSLGGVPYCPEVSKRFLIEVRAAPAAWEIPRGLLALLFLLAVFIGACLVATTVFALLWMRERKKKGQMGRQPTCPEVKPCKEVGFKTSKTCSACGKEFPRAYTFCPYCFTFHGKDYE